MRCVCALIHDYAYIHHIHIGSLSSGWAGLGQAQAGPSLGHVWAWPMQRICFVFVYVLYYSRLS